MTQFTLQLDNWYALESIHPLTQEGNHFVPAFMLAIKPRKSGKNLLGLRFQTPKEELRLECKVLKRTSDQMIVEIALGNIAVFREIGNEWLNRHYPELFESFSPAKSQYAPDFINAYLNSTYRLDAYAAAFPNYRQKHIVFHCEDFQHAIADGLPFAVTGQHLVELMDKAAQVVKVVFPDWDEPQNRILFHVDFGDEGNVLTACALRFDGYGYLKNEMGDDSEFVNRHLKQGTFPDDAAQRMTLFFLLQRYLGKWGGEYEPRYGKTWRIFRTLFFTVVNEPVPPQYQVRAYYRNWLHNYEPFRAQCIAIVRRVHETIAYDDNAKPLIDQDQN